MVMILLAVLVLAGVVGWALYQRKMQEKPGLIRTAYQPFRSSGRKIRPQDFPQIINQFNSAMLQSHGGFYEFFPNQRIIRFVLPPEMEYFAYCNLMEYMDMTRGVENKIRYGKDLPPTAYSSAA
jgi:hypothetical protein